MKQTNETKQINITKEEKDIFDLLLNISEIGYLDLKELSLWDNAIRKFEYDFSYIDEIESIGFDKIDTNTYFYVVIDRLFNLICQELEENINLSREEKKSLENLKDNFNPFINCLDSWFNNVFDELDLSLSKEEILNNAKKLLSKEV